MAEAIIRKWRLAVLRVELDLSSREPRVVTTLVGYPVGIPATLWSESFPAQAFGIPVHGPPGQLQVPDRLMWRVAASLREDLPDETALWLRLVPPYGYLGGAPWEEVLVPHVNRPVLRVPDRFPVAADFGDAWTAAIAIHARPDNTWAASYIRDLTNALRDHVGGTLAVHVFADADTRMGLLDPGDPIEPWVHLHDPSTAREALRSREAGRTALTSSSLTTRPPIGRAWSDWIAAGLAGRAVRSLHVVTDAAFDGDEPMLVVSADPNQSSPLKECSYVAVDGLLRLTASLGATTLSMGSPPDNLSDVATRMIVDHVGQGRPGPTIYSSIKADPHADAIASMHAYLADRTGDRELPWHRSLFAYVQPENVRDSLLEGWPEISERSTVSGDEVLPSIKLPTKYRPAAAASAYEQLEDVPAWVAASHAYLGSEYAKLARSADPIAKSVVRNAYDRGAAEALDKLRAIIEKHSGL